MKGGKQTQTLWGASSALCQEREPCYPWSGERVRIKLFPAMAVTVRPRRYPCGSRARCIPHPDPPGCSSLRIIRRLLVGRAKSTCITHLPDVPPSACFHSRRPSSQLSGNQRRPLELQSPHRCLDIRRRINRPPAHPHSIFSSQRLRRHFRLTSPTRHTVRCRPRRTQCEERERTLILTPLNSRFRVHVPLHVSYSCCNFDRPPPRG